MTRERVTQRVPQSDRDKATPRYRSQAERQSVREKKKNNWHLPALGQGQPWAPRAPAQQLFRIGAGGGVGGQCGSKATEEPSSYCNHRRSCYSLSGDRLGTLYPSSPSLGSTSLHGKYYYLHLRGEGTGAPGS